MSRTKVSSDEPADSGQSVAPFVNGPVGNGSSAKTAGVDWESMRLPQDFGDQLKTRRIAVSVAVQKPDRDSWVYIHPDPQWRRIMGLLTDKVNRRIYVATRDIQPEIADDIIPKLLVTYGTRSGGFGLWPIRMPDESGRLDTYNESAHAIVNMHAGKWLRVLLDQSEGAYHIIDDPTCTIPCPKWPEGGINGLLDLAFRGRIINSLEHPAVMALRRANL